MTIHHFDPEFMLTGDQVWPDLINLLVTRSSISKNYCFVDYCQEQTLFYTLCICCSWGGGYGQNDDFLRLA